MTDELKHFGIKMRSGRYPWGSGGEDAYQRSMDFYAYVDGLKNQGIPDKVIAKAIGLHVKEVTGDPRAGYTVADLRSTRTVAREEIIRAETARAVQLKEKNMSVKAISDEMGLPQATVRSRIKNSENMKQSALTSTADMLRREVDKHDIVDIGKGTELHVDTGTRVGISHELLRAATTILRDEGYETHTIPIRNVGTKHSTNQKVLVKPGTGWGGARKMADRIHTIAEWTLNEGRTFFGILPPISVSSKRLKVVTAEEGGSKLDGVVYVRPGVKDLDMGKNRYAQVRIAIDDSHYIKGMAILKDGLPDGVDLMFHTNKSKNDPKLRAEGKLGALKPLTDDEENRFGTVISRQIIGHDKNGKEIATSAMNMVNEEGDWDTWSKSLPSQMLSKQPHSLIKSQLGETRKQVAQKLDEISQITNPVVRQKEYENYADLIDSQAVDLKAAAMPRQQTHVILPVPSMSQNEVYAPRFETGERVVLIRYPHGGRFEIPDVVVNNNQRAAKKLLGNATDAIGIHPKVAERLSGADFDGDTVIVIPNRAGKIKSFSSMNSQAKVYEDGLNGFDPKRQYGGYEVITPAVGKKGDPGYKPEVGNFPTMKNTGKEMGVITNLITDMSIQGAKPEEIVRAVRHSMVVIDAEKHSLDYKQSERENNIKQLKDRYQGKPGDPKRGASTLLSRATSGERIPERKPRLQELGGPIDKETGERMYQPTGKVRNKYDPKTKTYTDEVVPKMEEVKKLALTKDAFSLVRDPSDPVESLYAEHANAMKALANTARLRAIRTETPRATKEAKDVYALQVAKLKADLKTAQKQKPLDRQADIIAGRTVKAKRQEDPLLALDSDRLAKVERQAKAGARANLGLEKPIIDIDDHQWDAIMANAVSPSMLRDVLEYADPARVAALAMPRKNTVMTSGVTARAKAMLAAGATTADVAAALGINASTLRAAALRGEV